ncbi:MAG: dihydroorotate dehydrogenase electron transfer subunit [Candidatus Aminicenantaceae bacterium]
MIKEPQSRIARKESWNDYCLFSIESPRIAQHARPGQFIMIRVNPHPYPLLRRPFSIHSRAKNTIEIFFQRIGVGTTLLAQKEADALLDILGPSGNGFSLNTGLKGKTVFLIGGGRGIAPLFFLAQELASLGAFVNIFYGGKSISDLCLKEKLEKKGFNLFCSTEDGSFGFKGLVTELLDEKIKNLIPEKMFVCGPEEMMKKIAYISSDKNIPAEFSLESTMGCGFGACWGCVRRIKRDNAESWLKICEEGPVFSTEEIIWQL